MRIDITGNVVGAGIEQVDTRLMPVVDSRPIFTKNILTEAECHALIRDIESRQETWHMAPVYADQGNSLAVNTDSRNTWFVPGTSPLLESAWAKMKLAAEEGKANFGFGLPELRPAGRQVLVYDAGQFFRPHADGYVLLRDSTGNSYWARNTPQREFVTILWLTKQTAQAEGFGTHTGGEFFFPHIEGLDPVKSTPGQFLMIPTHPGYVHGVKRVHSGRRYSITQWWSVFHGR